MSHVATVDLEIKDLDALGAACRRIGCELVRGQQTYRWFGKSVGDYPLPDGFTAEELGKCEHAIRVVDLNSVVDPNTWPGSEAPYEIGVLRRRDGRPGYTLLWDFFAGGHGLQKCVGEDCNGLKQAYAAEVAKKQAIAGGFRVSEKQQQDGSIRLVLTK